GAPAGVGDGHAGVAGDLDHRAIVAPGHDHADAAVGVADRVLAGDVVGDAVTRAVDEVALQHPQHRIIAVGVHGVGGQAEGVHHEPFGIGVGDVQRVGGQAPAEIAGAAEDGPG